MLWSSFLLTKTSSQDVISTSEQNEDSVWDLCTGLSRKLYCTCYPSDYDTQDVKCVLLQNVKPEDAVWKVIANAPKLQYIELTSHAAENYLTYFPAELVRPDNVIEKIIMQHGAIDTIPSMAFKNSSRLLQVDLSQNRIEHLKHFAFSYLPELQDLTLSGNDLRILNKTTFVELSKLKCLYLDQNKMETIEEGAFYGLNSLEELDLKKNFLKDVKPGTFKGLSRLRQLDLGYNNISNVGRNAFIGLSSVVAIDLRDNAVTYIDSMAFHGLPNLMTLFLVKNRLVHLHDGMFRSLKRLSYVDLRYNQLETLTEQAIAPILKHNNRTHIYLLVSGNKFVCDCRIQWIHKMMERKNSNYSTQHIDWGNLTCTPPNGKRLQDDFDLQADESHSVNNNIPIVLSDASTYLEICSEEKMDTSTDSFIEDEEKSSELPSAAVVSFQETITPPHNMASLGSMNQHQHFTLKLIVPILLTCFIPFMNL